jgi:hypothetical protein
MMLDELWVRPHGHDHRDVAIATCVSVDVDLLDTRLGGAQLEALERGDRGLGRSRSESRALDQGAEKELPSVGKALRSVDRGRCDATRGVSQLDDPGAALHIRIQLCEAGKAACPRCSGLAEVGVYERAAHPGRLVKQVDTLLVRRDQADARRLGDRVPDPAAHVDLSTAPHDHGVEHGGAALTALPRREREPSRISGSLDGGGQLDTTERRSRRSR